MKPNRKKYQLSKEALDSVISQTNVDAELDLNRNGKKGNTFLLINQETGDLQFIIPYKFNNNFYAAHFPNPVELFFKQANEHKSKVDLAVESFEKNVEFVYEQNKDSQSKIKMVNPDIFDEFLIHKVSCLTSLISTVEAFVNETIPEDFKILNKKCIEVGKFEVERFWDLKSKLKHVIPKIVEVENKKYEVLVSKFLEMNNLRNEFIHMKFKTDSRNFDPYIDNFQMLINLDLNQSILEVKTLINSIKDSYL